jgi:probable rRNA maturation factor
MVINQQRRVRVALPALRAFLGRVHRALGTPKRSVTVCFVTDAAMARLNLAFRGKPRSTDVLSFPAQEPFAKRRKQAMPKKGHHSIAAAGRGDGFFSFASAASSTSRAPFYLGDIAISPQTAQRNARRFGRTLPEELRVLILHGMLHLLGFDHETDHGEMQRYEARLRRCLGIA